MANPFIVLHADPRHPQHRHYTPVLFGTYRNGTETSQNPVNTDPLKVAAILFAATNSIEDSWLAIINKNENIQISPLVPMPKSARSTSVGDVVVIHDNDAGVHAFECKPMGWQKIPLDTVARHVNSLYKESFDAHATPALRVLRIDPKDLSNGVFKTPTDIEKYHTIVIAPEIEAISFDRVKRNLTLGHITSRAHLKFNDSLQVASVKAKSIHIETEQFGSPVLGNLAVATTLDVDRVKAADIEARSINARFIEAWGQIYANQISTKSRNPGIIYASGNIHAGSIDSNGQIKCGRSIYIDGKISTTPTANDAGNLKATVVTAENGIVATNKIDALRLINGTTHGIPVDNHTETKFPISAKTIEAEIIRSQGDVIASLITANQLMADGNIKADSLHTHLAYTPNDIDVKYDIRGGTFTAANIECRAISANSVTVQGILVSHSADKEPIVGVNQSGLNVGIAIDNPVSSTTVYKYDVGGRTLHTAMALHKDNTASIFHAREAADLTPNAINKAIARGNYESNANFESVITTAKSANLNANHRYVVPTTPDHQVARRQLSALPHLEEAISKPQDQKKFASNER